MFANADPSQRKEAERKLAAELAPVKSEAEQLRDLDKLAKPARMAAAVAAYCFCSASLLVINKVAVHKLPSPSFLLFCQFFASAVVVKLLSIMGVLVVEPMTIANAKAFSGISLLFCVCLYTNVKSLEFANVETVIVFRASTPIFVAICDWFFRGEPLPSGRSWIALFSILVGAAVYVMTDEGFHVTAYFWVCGYLVSIIAEMVYTKYVVEELPMSTWSRVYYNNVISIPPVLLLGFINGEFNRLLEEDWSGPQITAIMLSCVVGVGISYAGFNLRALVTATSFTVIGVLNKIFSVLINVLIWDHHANTYGISALVVCILAGTFYQQNSKKR